MTDTTTQAAPADPWTLSAAEATARLQSMKPQAPAADLTAPAPDVAAMTSAQARLRRDQLLKNPDFQQRYLSDSKKEVDQINDLIAKEGEAAAARLDAALAHGDETAPLIPEVTFDGALNSAKLAKVVDHLYEAGLEPSHIREAFDEDMTIDFDTYAAVLQLQQQRFGDADYVKRYLAGGAAEVREMALIHIVLGMNIEETAA
jgi:hypothetical protein